MTKAVPTHAANGFQEDGNAEGKPFISETLCYAYRAVGIGCAAVAFMASALALAVLVFPLVKLLPRATDEKNRRIRGIIGRSFAVFLNVLYALRLMRPPRVIGLEHIANLKSYIVAANHPSLLDIVILGSLIPEFNCVVKHKLLTHLFLGRCIKAAGYVTNNNPKGFTSRSVAVLAGSQPLIIFPEGTRSPQNGLGPFNSGAAYLTLRCGVPLVFAVVKCSPPIFSKHRKWYVIPEKRIQYTVEFFPPANFIPEKANGNSLAAQARDLNENIRDFFRQKLREESRMEVRDFRPAILIPNHNHKDAIVPLLERLGVYGIDCLIVDDGSDRETQQVLEEQSRTKGWVRILRRPKQGGKGAAVLDGLHLLHAEGYTHAIQMDADGQHDSDDLPKFLRESKAHPTALVLGSPTYGPDVPKIRLSGRQISRVLVWLETFSFAIGDPLLGYRVYPLKETAELTKRCALGTRMDFDPEIAVRLKWKGVPIRNISTRVSYPENGSSNFRIVTDNLWMVALHLRLLSGMFFRPLAALRKGNA